MSFEMTPEQKLFKRDYRRRIRRAVDDELMPIRDRIITELIVEADEQCDGLALEGYRAMPSRERIEKEVRRALRQVPELTSGE